MMGRFSLRSGVTVAAVLVAVVLPGSRSIAAPALSVTAQGIRVVASGAALVVNSSITCTDPRGVSVSAFVTQQTSRGVQHGSGSTGAQICDGVAHAVKIVVYPPPALVPPESVHAVYERAWTNHPVLLRVGASTSEDSVQKDKLVTVEPATPSDPSIAPVAARKANGAGVIVTMRFSCRHGVSSDPSQSDMLLLNFAQVGSENHVQQVSASALARCDNGLHTYKVPFAAIVQRWNPAPAFVEADICSGGSGYCSSFARTVFRTVTVQP